MNMDLAVGYVLIGLAICCAAAAVTIILTFYYKRIPFRTRGVRKPKFDLFPKYEVQFHCSPDAIRQSLVSLKFEASKGDPNYFSRGKIYGDLSAKAAKWRVQINPDRNAFQICAQWIILFDTGDTWQLIEEILATARDQAAHV